VLVGSQGNLHNQYHLVFGQVYLIPISTTALRSLSGLSTGDVTALVGGQGNLHSQRHFVVDRVFPRLVIFVEYTRSMRLPGVSI
jgi:hypothetical protein